MNFNVYSYYFDIDIMSNTNNDVDTEGLIDVSNFPKSKTISCDTRS